MITRYTDFKDLTYIPIHDSSSPLGEAIINDIEAHIKDNEPDIMIEFGGGEFYDFVLAKLDETPIDPLYSDLRNRLSKALVNFIYVKYDQFRQSMSIEVGERTAKGANQEHASAFTKQRNIYNRGVKELRSVYDFLKSNEDYPEFEDKGFEFKTINVLNL